MIAQMCEGKGLERHATADRFEDQMSWKIIETCGAPGPIFQMLKKAMETMEYFIKKNDDLPGAYHELIGALNYGVFACRIIKDQIDNSV